MSNITKSEFVELAESKLGYDSYKDLLEDIGYSKRYLDRFTYESELKTGFLEIFDKWLAKNKNTPDSDTVETEADEYNQDVEYVEEEPKQEAEVEPVQEKPVEQKTPVEPVQEVPVDNDDANEGLGETVTNKQYHNSSNLSSSRIKMVLENAREFYEVYVSGNARKSYTDALLVGSLHHTLVLEPENFDRDYIVLGLDNPLKDDLVRAVERLGGTVERKENGKGELHVVENMSVLRDKLNDLRGLETRTIVTTNQVELAKKTSQKALDSWYVIEANGKTLLKAQLKEVIELENSFVERTFYGEIGGVKVQVRPDLLMNLGKTKPVWFCVDLKTAEDATMGMFMKQSARFFYDLQEWVYREVLRQNGINVVDFRFQISGKSDSSGSAYYKLFNEDVQDIGKVVEKAIEKYKYCRDNDIWEEGKFDFKKMRFNDVTTIRIPTYRQFQLIDAGVM